jgi:4-amino-4-deoxy-L-arabinose transferase-like glycosyltransferase
VSGLSLLPLDLDTWEPAGAGRKAAKYAYAHRLLRENRDRIDDITFAVRLPHILLGALLGIGIWYVTRRLFGPVAAIGALVLYSTDPNVLAHARLLHTDADPSALGFLAVACLVFAMSRRSSWRYPIMAGTFLTLALLAKYSSLLLLIVFPVLAVFGPVAVSRLGARDRGAGNGFSRDNARCSLLRVGLCLAILVPLLMLVFYRGQIAWYFRGLGMVLEHNKSGHLAYLMGEWSTRGWWYYFPIAMAVKTPVPLLLLAIAGIAYIARRLPGAQGIQGTMFVIAFGIWLAGAIASSVNIGIRHILPAYVFLFVFAGATVRSWAGNRAGRIALGGLLVWAVVSAVRTYPDYIAYFNEPAGGPAGGARYLVASNLDWGQELISLKRYMDEEGIQEIAIHTIGAPVPDIYGIKKVRIEDTAPAPDKPVYFAMGATYASRLLHIDPAAREETASFLSDSEEMTTLGHSLTVYRVTRPFPGILKQIAD